MSRLWQPDSERLSSRVVGLETDFSHVALESFDNARQGSPQEPWIPAQGESSLANTDRLGEQAKLVLWENWKLKSNLFSGLP